MSTFHIYHLPRASHGSKKLHQLRIPEPPAQPIKKLARFPLGAQLRALRATTPQDSILVIFAKEGVALVTYTPFSPAFA